MSHESVLVRYLESTKGMHQLQLQLQLQDRTMEELSLHLPVPAMPSSREDINFDFYLGKVRRETQVKRPNKSKLKDESLTNIPLISQSFSTAGMCMSFGNLE